MPYLNQTILALDSKQSMRELVSELNAETPDYVVLRHAGDAAGIPQFFVFPSDYLRFDLLGHVSGRNRRQALAQLLPQLRREAAAPQQPSHSPLQHWNSVYDSGPWEAAFYPVAVAHGHVIGVWEAGESHSASRGADEITMPSPTKTTGRDYQNTSPPTKTTAQRPLSTIKDLLGGLFQSSSSGQTKREHTAPTPAPGSIEEALEAAEREAAGIEAEIDSLLQHHTLFPNIEASDSHPVAEQAIDITVSLQTKQVRGITGKVNLPVQEDDDFIFEIKVHLLCAADSQWSLLRYSQSAGMLQPATFRLGLPDMPLDANGDYPDRHKLPLRVNFYFENRWCGEGERYLDLRLDDSVPPLKRIPAPPASAWRDLINLEPLAEPPDLLVRISNQPGSNSYHWSCLSPHLEFDQSLNAVITLSGNSQQFVNKLFEPFSTRKLETLQMATLKGVCEEIYDSTPDLFKHAYWRLADAAKTGQFSFKHIVFITDEAHIPWELMRVTDPTLRSEPEILAIRHPVGRWLAQSSNYLTQQITIKKFVATGSDYSKQLTIKDLPWVNAELQGLSQQYHATTIPLNTDAVMDFLQHGEAQAMHFACHGTMSASSPLSSELIMEDYPRSITPPNISAYEVQTGLGRQHPLIFLNACEAGANSTALSLVSGFPAAFLKAGASAVICPLWTISDQEAQIISAAFYQAAFEQPGITLGEIMQQIHERWESGNQLTYLAYVLYGDPQTRIQFTPEIP